ncbi:hypothetical protein RND81_04G206300 [Saponaria officinalis]|uniref:PWWP domain-containing protein n=1 Tax=Saponaria officinalis TaxID=3572 RepID=A0AAW1LPG3_SAPOF
MEEEKIRVSNEEFNDDDDDLNLNVEIRDNSGGVKSEIDEIRVLPREGGDGGDLGDYHVNGDSKEVDGIRLSSAIDEIDRNGEVIVIGEDSEPSNVDLGKTEMVKPETSGISGTEKSSEIVKRGKDKGKSKVSGSGRKGKLGLSSSYDFGGEGDNESRRKEVRKDEGSCMDVKDGDLWAPVSKNFFGIDVDDSLMRSLSAKVMGSEFEMGDMVWGKVKSHPWWPGHLYNEAFASSSVRRVRRDGNILVAFFGDSSYGWFDPEDLVPYDLHYAEKSQQTSSKNFVRAVDESVDESSRRSALGLSCYCRSPFNFRPTDVPGYLAVDIADFEPGTVYSISQIQKARDSFRPAETLSFIHQLATSSMGSDRRNLNFIKNKAIALAYRKSTFEEFDETYAEAFGHKPERPQLPQTPVAKEPSRAPLSGPLVFADTRGVRKSSAKATKPKSQSKKDKYLFKRRDESHDMRTSTMSQGHASPSTSSAYDDETSNSAADGYVFQKRDQATSNNELGESPAIDQLTASAYAVTSEDVPTGRDLTPASQHLELDEAGTADMGDDVRRASDRPNSIVSSSAGNVATSGTLSKKKKKATKRPASELSSGKPEPREKKIKKSKKSGDFRSSERSERHPPVLGGGSPVNPVGKPTQAVASTREKTMDVDLTNPAPQEVGLVPMAVDWENEAEVRQILADLHDLALNPSHGLEKNVPALTRHFLLKFRSLVYLKSSYASAIADSELGEAQAADRPPTESSKTVSSLKPLKGLSRQDEWSKVGKKRIPSERQEENAAKRAKKITDVKSLTAEKRSQMKNPELQQSDGKSKVNSAQSAQSKPIKGEQHGKKVDRPPRVQEPTYLIMKYQSGSNLPSHAELKARFTRFGPLDTSLSRVFYKTDTCRVAFLYKQDANVAYRYAVGSKSLFSNVRFMLKPVAEPQQPVTGKTEGLNGEPRLNPDPSTVESRPPMMAVLPQPVQPLKSILKKSSGGDESGVPNNGGGGSRTTRVRFNVGDEKSSASNRGGLQVQLNESRNPVLASKDGAPSTLISISTSTSSTTTSIAVDINNNQRLSSLHPLQAPLLPFPRPPTNLQYNNHSEITPRNNHQLSLTATTTTSIPGVSQALPPPPPPPAPPSTDISQQMMSLLTRCHDLVTNVKSTLGYLPYHPL